MRALFNMQTRGKALDTSTEHCALCKSHKPSSKRDPNHAYQMGVSSCRCMLCKMLKRLKRERSRGSTFGDQELGRDPVSEFSTQGCLLAPWGCHPSATSPILPVFSETFPCMPSSSSLVPSRPQAHISSI